MMNLKEFIDYLKAAAKIEKLDLYLSKILLDKEWDGSGDTTGDFVKGCDTITLTKTRHLSDAGYFYFGTKIELKTKYKDIEIVGRDDVQTLYDTIYINKD